MSPAPTAFLDIAVAIEQGGLSHLNIPRSIDGHKRGLLVHDHVIALADIPCSWASCRSAPVRLGVTDNSISCVICAYVLSRRPPRITDYSLLDVLSGREDHIGLLSVKLDSPAELVL